MDFTTRTEQITLKMLELLCNACYFVSINTGLYEKVASSPAPRCGYCTR